jgi:hypothetical protein
MKKIHAFIFTIAGLLSFNCDKQSTIAPAPPINECLKTPSNMIPSATNKPICQRVLIDASRDGGVWWFPQASNFQADQGHQGLAFEQALRDAGFQVDVLPRGSQITDDLLNHYGIVVRGNIFQDPYTQDSSMPIVNRSIAASHCCYSQNTSGNANDGLATTLGVTFEGELKGTVQTFANNKLVQGVSSMNYVAGSSIAATNETYLTPLAWVNNEVVMALLDHPHSRIFLIGDTNTVEFLSQPFTNNLISWMQEASCNDSHK